MRVVWQGAEMTGRAAVAVERTALWAEFLALFVAVPVALALLLPSGTMFPVLFAATLLGLWLLHRTPGFRWSDLWQGAEEVTWLRLMGFGAVTLAVSVAVLLAVAPESLFALLRGQPLLWLAVVGLYPVLSALPQELLFRPLFFRRYRPILPRRGADLCNAALFSLAHLMYWSWIVAVLTFAGGLVFAWAYRRRGSFPLAVALHAVAGIVLFTAGMGMFFYSGNVDRPF
jgi:membrane protease YdiL (CAAX protease family)